MAQGVWHWSTIVLVNFSYIVYTIRILWNHYYNIRKTKTIMIVVFGWFASSRTVFIFFNIVKTLLSMLATINDTKQHCNLCFSCFITDLIYVIILKSLSLSVQWASWVHPMYSLLPRISHYHKRDAGLQRWYRDRIFSIRTIVLYYI